MVKLLGERERWKNVELKEIGKVSTGKTPPTRIKEYWNGEISFITPEDLVNGKYINNPKRHISEKGIKEANGLLPKDTIAVVCIGSIGNISILKNPAVTNQQINSIICNEDVNPEYVYYQILHRKKTLENLAGINVVKIIKKSLFEKIKIPLPPLSEQNRIVNILSTIDEKLEFERKRKGKLERLKKGLMNELLTGNKRVNVEKVLKVGK